MHAVVVRSTFPSQNGKSTTCSNHCWRFNRTTLQHNSSFNYNNSNYILQLQLHCNYTLTTLTATTNTTTTTTTTTTARLQLHYAAPTQPTLHCTTLFYIFQTILRCTKLHLQQLHYAAPAQHNTTLHYATLHFSNYTTLH